MELIKSEQALQVRRESQIQELIIQTKLIRLRKTKNVDMIENHITSLNPPYPRQTFHIICLELRRPSRLLERTAPNSSHLPMVPHQEVS